MPSWNKNQKPELKTVDGVSCISLPVLSLTEPWGTLIVTGEKKIESRSWQTSYRGPILIATSANMPVWACYTILRDLHFWDALKFPLNTGKILREMDSERKQWSYLRSFFPLGKIIGIAELTDIKSTDMTKLFAGISEQERAFGDYSANRFGWFIKDACRLETQIPAKGALGLWSYDLPVSALPKSYMNILAVQWLQSDFFTGDTATLPICTL